MKVMCDRVEHHSKEYLDDLPYHNYEVILKQTGLYWVSFDWNKEVVHEGTLSSCRNFLRKLALDNPTKVGVRTRDFVTLDTWELNYPLTHTGYWISE